MTMVLHLNKPKSKFSRTFHILAGFTSLVSGLVMVAPAVSAATLTVEFTGTVNDLSRFAFVGFTPFEENDLPTLTTRNTGKEVNLGDQIVGRYLFDEDTNEITSARFRFVAPGADAGLAPFEADLSDIVFDPSIDTPPPPPNTSPTFPIIVSDSFAGESFARYTQNISTADTNQFSSLSLSAGEPLDQTFSYIEASSARSTGGASTSIQGILTSLMVVETDAPPSPVDVPEPAATLGLLIASGLVFSLRRASSAQC